MPEDRLEREIAEGGRAIVELDRLLGEEEVYRDPDRCRTLLEQRAALKEKLDRLEEEWLRRAER
jgi:hypothetical protein